ncbi:MAG: trigger factor [Chloroflexota bacterium]
MKVTTEKLPKSLLSLTVEIDRAQVEKGLDRAARRVSQKYNIPGFRKGKAPRFIVENYFGRETLVEEASEDLINRSFKEALEQENIEPIGQANLEETNFQEEPFHFRATIPVAPTVTIPDYRAIQVPAELREVTDEMVQQALDTRREEHVVLREPEDPRPAQQGDQLTVQLESFVDDEPLDDRNEEGEIPESTMVLEPDRLAEGLFDGLIGIETEETREINVRMPEDHPNEQIRDKDVLFKIKLISLQERLLPDWEELPTLEEFEGTLDELRDKTRKELEETAEQEMKRTTVDEYVKQLTEQTEYDIADAMIQREAERLLQNQAQSFERYGITLDQMLQYRNQTREDAAKELLPQAEEQLKTTLALGEIVQSEQLSIDESEIEEEVTRVLDSYKEEERDAIRNMLNTQLRPSIANNVLNQKLMDRLFLIATGTAPELPVSADNGAEDDDTEEKSDEQEQSVAGGSTTPSEVTESRE